MRMMMMMCRRHNIHDPFRARAFSVRTRNLLYCADPCGSNGGFSCSVVTSSLSPLSFMLFLPILSSSMSSVSSDGLFGSMHHFAQETEVTLVPTRTHTTLYLSLSATMLTVISTRAREPPPPSLRIHCAHSAFCTDHHHRSAYTYAEQKHGGRLRKRSN